MTTTAHAAGATTATLQLDDASPEVRDRARSGLAIYFGLVVLLTGVLDAIIIGIGNADMDSLALLTMFVPALSSVVARLALREGFADVSFRLGGRRGLLAILVTPLLPIGVGLIAYGSAWTSGLAQFAPQSVGEVTARLATFIVPSVILVSGEEIGWRGYMLTRLIDARVPQAIVVSGLVWGLWHVPLVLAGVMPVGPSRELSAVLLVTAATALGVVIARLRLATGSVWPAVAMHVAWNLIIIEGFNKLTTGPQALLWAGEYGILTTVTLVVAAILCSRGHWTMLRQPA